MEMIDYNISEYKGGAKKMSSSESKKELTVKSEVRPTSKINKKQIGFLSVIIMVVSSTIGAGIFFKSGTVLDLTSNSLVLSTISWVIAAFGIIALALALIEVASASKNDLSVIGWCKSFNSRFIYKSCKNFMFYIYVPLTYFFMPLYVLSSIQDSISGFGGNHTFGTSNDWAIWMVLSILIVLWFIILSGFSSRAGKIQSWIITAVKFIPLVVAALIGFIILGVNNQGVANPALPPSDSTNTPNTFYGLSPYLGMFAAISSIFFAFDGFYTAAGVQSQMKEPKKTPLALVIGLSIVTVVYLLISISMSLGSKGGLVSGLEEFFKSRGIPWFYGLFNLFIAFGILGIINGYAMWTPLFIQELIKSNELPFSAKWVEKINHYKAPVVGICYSLVVTIPVMIIFCMIGGLSYLPIGYAQYDQTLGAYISNYDASGYISAARLYAFADLMSTWATTGVFAFIATSILGGLLNRYRIKKNINTDKHIEIQKNRYFIPFGIIAVTIVYFSLSLEVLNTIVNLGMIGMVKENYNDELLSRIMLFIVLILFVSITFITSIVEINLLKKTKTNHTISNK